MVKRNSNIIRGSCQTSATALSLVHLGRRARTASVAGATSEVGITTDSGRTTSSEVMVRNWLQGRLAMSGIRCSSVSTASGGAIMSDARVER